jgi:UDP-N-acetylmuramoylalanine-D-glutamate ligase
MAELGLGKSQSAYLRAQADRCFRLAQGMASLELFDELEAIGRAFEREAARLEKGEEQSEWIGRL